MAVGELLVLPLVSDDRLILMYEPLCVLAAGALVLVGASRVRLLRGWSDGRRSGVEMRMLV